MINAKPDMVLLARPDGAKQFSSRARKEKEEREEKTRRRKFSKNDGSYFLYLLIYLRKRAPVPTSMSDA